MGLLTFINNIRYLARYDLKKMYVKCRYAEYALDHIRYEIEADLKSMKKVEIRPGTLEKLLNSECSISRFGDGEVMLAFGESIPCQNYTEEAGRKLREALASNDDRLMVCIPNLYASLADVPENRRKYDREFLGHHTPQLLKLLHEDKVYYSPSLSSYICTGAKTEELVKSYEKNFSDYRRIWQNKDIVIVCGDRVFKNIKNNIYDNARSIKYIYGPTNNAFSEYNSILEKVKKEDKNKLIILILGPAASALAYDLTLEGRRALDMGHLCKDYDAFIRRIDNTDKNIKAFFNKE